MSSGYDNSTQQSSQQRIKLNINRYNQVVGAGKNQYKSRLGKLVRTHLPIAYNDWRLVPMSYKEDVWKELLSKFELPRCHKSECFKTMGTMLKTWRHTLRDNYYKRYQSDAERLANVPPLVKREQWKEFVTNESTIDAQKKSETGKLNRSKIGATHTSGRNGQAQVEYNLKQKKTDDKPDPTRVDVWIESHSHKDGTVPKSLAPVVDQVKTKKRELESTSSNSQSQSLLDDALSHVFGKDTRGRTRGVGSTVPRSSIEASMPAIYLLENEIAEGKEMKGRLHNLETYVKDMNSNISNELSTIKSLLSSTMGKQSQFMAGNGVNATPGASSSSNMDHSLLDGVSCDIKGFNGKVIGKGRIDSSPREMMHGHLIDFKEEIVLIVDTVLDANALLYLGQQGGAENLGDICSGGWIVWPKSLVKRIR